MPIALWDNNYKTGHPMVDKQHEELFRMVNSLHDEIVAGKGKEALGPTLQELARYTIKHFTDEEALMASINYPLIAPHKQKHAELTQKVKDMMEKFREGKLVFSVTVSAFLADWLRHHIKEDDVALIKFLKERNRAQTAAASR